MIGHTIGNYQILSLLGEGGMGVVYLAQHRVIGRRAAIKLLLPELSSHAEMVARIFNEARVTGELRHPGIVDIYDFGRHDNGCAYIVMELLEGESLSAYLARQKKLPPAMTVALARQIAGALAAAHARGIVHRDLKPDNVFLVADGEMPCGIRTKLLDFGIAKAAQGSMPEHLRTRTGSIVGTPAYMSPEQCRGTGSTIVDGRADIYALGCILFEMLCGRRVFAYESMGELIAAQLYEPPAPPTTIERSIPAWLEAVVLASLAKDPAQRPQSMDELMAALGGRGATPLPKPPRAPTALVSRVPTTLGRMSGQLAGAPRARRGLAVAVAAVTSLAAAAAIAFAVSRRAPAPPPPAATETVRMVPVPMPMTPPAAVAPPDAGLPPDAAPAPVVEVAEEPTRPTESKRPKTKRTPSKEPPPAPAPPRPAPEPPKPAPPPPDKPDDSLDPYSN